MFATAVRIDARLEPDIRTVVPRDNRLRQIAKELRLRPRLLFFIARRVNLDHVFIAEVNVQLLEPVGRVPRSASAMNRSGGRGRLFDNGNELALFALRHVASSHEHIWWTTENRRIEIRK
jgi:hypothetical protein